MCGTNLTQNNRKEMEQKRFNLGVKALPWLILTNNEHIVTVEGFSINELEEKIITLSEK